MGAIAIPTEAEQLSEILDRIKAWPLKTRIALAKGILDTLDVFEASPPPRGRPVEEMIGPGAPETTGRPPRGLSAEEVQGLLKTDRPAPDDETVRRRIDERRMEKYGR